VRALCGGADGEGGGTEPYHHMVNVREHPAEKGTVTRSGAAQPAERRAASKRDAARIKSQPDAS
jgi:hypothetical protein